MSDDEKKRPPIAEAPGKTVTFKMQWNSYNAGEAATFNEVDAKALIDRGIATEGGEGKPPDDVPEGVVFSAVAGIEHPPRIYPAQSASILRFRRPSIRRRCINCSGPRATRTRSNQA